MKTKFAIGDRVRYSSKFLNCIQAYSGWYPQVRGEITGFTGDLAAITWDFPSNPDRDPFGANDPSHVNTFNLQRIRNHG